MKKIYNSPQLSVRTISTEEMIAGATSFTMNLNSEEGSGDDLVKGENSNVSSSNDVWDKVWNREGLSN